VRTRILLAGVLTLMLLPLPGGAQSVADTEHDGLAAIMGEVRKVDAEGRVLFVDRFRVHVPSSVKGFDELERGQRVVVRLNPDTASWTASAIEVLP
jgi:hypothetical protein